jgi:hypothetical protein
MILAVCVLLWYRYSGSDYSNRYQEQVIASKIARSYPVSREKLVSQAAIIDQEVATPIQAPYPVVSSQSSEQLGSASPLDDEELSHPIAEDKSTNNGPALIPAEDKPDDTPAESNAKSDKAKENEPAVGEVIDKVLAPEYSEEDPEHKEPILDSRKKHLHDHAEVIEEEPPELVKQGSSKLIEQHLSPAPKYDKVPTTEIMAAERLVTQESGNGKFPPYIAYANMVEQGESLPDIIHIPFEDATKDVVLAGWEDEWFANAEVDAAKWGKIKEPKIDFVYTCEFMKQEHSRLCL